MQQKEVGVVYVVILASCQGERFGDLGTIGTLFIERPSGFCVFDVGVQKKKKSWEKKTQCWPPNTSCLSPDQQKQDVKGDQVLPIDVALCLLLENVVLILSWRSQARMSLLCV